MFSQAIIIPEKNQAAIKKLFDINIPALQELNDFCKEFKYLTEDLVTENSNKHLTMATSKKDNPKSIKTKQPTKIIKLTFRTTLNSQVFRTG